MCFIEMRRLAVSTRYVNASINVKAKKSRGKIFSKVSENRHGEGANGSRVWVSYHHSVFILVAPRAFIFVYSPERVQRCGYYPGLFRVGQNIKFSMPLARILHYSADRGKNFCIWELAYVMYYLLLYQLKMEMES